MGRMENVIALNKMSNFNGPSPLVIEEIEKKIVILPYKLAHSHMN